MPSLISPPEKSRPEQSGRDFCRFAGRAPSPLCLLRTLGTSARTYLDQAMKKSKGKGRCGKKC